MKKIFIILLLVVSGFVFCQEKQPKVNRNEIKCDILGSIGMTGAELSYEYILNKHRSVGGNIMIGAVEYDTALAPAVAFRPFFKQYFFSTKYGGGLFVKLVGNLNYHHKDKRIGIGPGAFLGYKIRMIDLVIEFDVGLDTEIYNYYKLKIANLVSIIGISIGVAF